MIPMRSRFASLLRRTLPAPAALAAWLLLAAAPALAEARGATDVPLPPQPTAEAPRFEDIKLIDYDFKTYGDPAKRKELLERWDREVGAAAN